jgi:Microfibril-associated/Pre-mRNA processing
MLCFACVFTHIVWILSRNLTEEERKREDLELKKAGIDMKNAKAKWGFMQRYYHKVFTALYTTYCKYACMHTCLYPHQIHAHTRMRDSVQTVVYSSYLCTLKYITQLCMHTAVCVHSCRHVVCAFSQAENYT